MEDKTKLQGSLHIWLDDHRAMKYNESTDVSFDLYCEENDELLPIDEFVDYCMRFALAVGFCEDTVYRAFGQKQELVNEPQL